MLGNRYLRALAAVVAVAIAAAWWLTRPQSLAAADLPDHDPDPVAGERVFWAGGCASCHATPVDGRRAKGDDKLLLGGGLELDTPYGVFRVPNISSHPDHGIGAWRPVDFVNAMQRGVSPDGRHYYPSFPYTSYARMPVEGVLDLKAFLDTLPPVEGRVAGHSLGFPWSIRRGLGAWKRRYLDVGAMTAGTSETPVDRGRLLVEGAGHCGECHTPRDRFGGLRRDRWLAGAPNPEGEGRVPNITPGGKNISAWSAADIAYYLESGFTPEFDTVGGSMVAVQENMSMLSDEDRAAIAAYLKALPALD
jgi:mono/diheme cytochrome c family protein